MPHAEARIPTSEPGRYLTRLCQHAAKIDHRMRHRHGPADRDRPQVQHVDWDSGRGVITLDRGTCTLRAGDGLLSVVINAADDTALHAIKGILTADLERFGHRDRLVVTWTSPGSLDPNSTTA